MILDCVHYVPSGIYCCVHHCIHTVVVYTCMLSIIIISMTMFGLTLDQLHMNLYIHTIHTITGEFCSLLHKVPTHRVNFFQFGKTTTISACEESRDNQLREN